MKNNSGKYPKGKPKIKFCTYNKNIYPHIYVCIYFHINFIKYKFNNK